MSAAGLAAEIILELILWIAGLLHGPSREQRGRVRGRWQREGRMAVVDDVFGAVLVLVIVFGGAALIVIAIWTVAW